MLEFARIAVGDGDPFGCSSCVPREQASYHAVADVAERIDGAVAGWVQRPGPNLVLTGPEPFAHPELPALVAACVRAGAERVAVETDGAALSVAANVSGLLAAGVRHIHWRLLDADDASVRARDARSGVAAFLEAASGAGLPVAVTAFVPVCRHNLQAVPDTVSVLAGTGVHGVRLLGGAGLGPSAGALLAAACDTGMVNGLWVEAEAGLPLPPSHRLHQAGGTRE